MKNYSLLQIVWDNGKPLIPSLDINSKKQNEKKEIQTALYLFNNVVYEITVKIEYTEQHPVYGYCSVETVSPISIQTIQYE